MNRILSKAKPSIAIALNDQQESFAPAYTSLDEVSGHVSITAPSNTQFEQICKLPQLLQGLLPMARAN